jgi:hypothetical protein
MPQVKVTCLYCGKTYEVYAYSPSEIESLRCVTCGDSNLKVVPVKQDTTDVFGYKSNAPKPDAYIKRKK